MYATTARPTLTPQPHKISVRSVQGLNPEQAKAVAHNEGPALVLAGAGSGKTRVITTRIVRLIGEGVSPEEICAVTFTNKAAGEMRHRVANLLGSKEGANQISLGTFHSLGLRVIKKEYKELGLPRQFAIFDTGDQLGLLRELSRRAGLDKKYDLKAVLSRISLAKNASIPAELYEGDVTDDYAEATEVLYPKYQEALRLQGAVDFDDLIMLPTMLWKQNVHLAERWRSMFRFLMVDEFQDSNKAQLEMLEILAAPENNILAVGDDDQSIYGWRGADPTNILNFDQRFPGAVIIRLEQNYRSTPIILRAANTLIAKNNDRLGKELWSDRTDVAPIVHAVAPEPNIEAQFIAEEMHKLRREIGCMWSSFAVLYRSNLQAQAVEEALREANVPYRLLGGQQFYERKEVKDVLAYLRFIINNRDEIALRRIINYPARGIGATTVRKAATIARTKRIPMWKGFQLLADDPETQPRTKRAIENFALTIQSLEEMVTRDPSAGIRTLVDRIELYADLRDAANSASAAQRRIENVERLALSMGNYFSKSPGTDVGEYLRRLSLASDEQKEEDVDDKVTLATLHSSKGLEFSTVFFVGLEENIIPHARTLAPTKADIFDLEKVGDISEERRLAYVGITRAKNRLYLTRSVYRGSRGKKPTPSEPSRFLFELPEETFEVRDIENELATPAPTEDVRDLFRQLADL